MARSHRTFGMSGMSGLSGAFGAGALALSLVISLAACSDDSGTPAGDSAGSGVADSAGGGGADGGASGDAAGPARSRELIGKSCNLKIGDNASVTFGGIKRRVVLHTANVGQTFRGKLPVVFAFHGLGWDSFLFHAATRAPKDAEPFIKIVPQALTPNYPAWDFKTDPAQSVDVKLFEEIIACLQKDDVVDTSRIHIMGFSMGGHWVDYLMTHRGDRVASFAQLSGGFFSFPKSSPYYFEWPADTLLGKLTRRAAGMVVWGGKSDFVNNFPFDQAATASITLFRKHGHFVLRCEHTLGHKVPADGFIGAVYSFFAKHDRSVTTSPWASALPSGFPSYCTIAP